MGRPDYIFGQFRETAKCRDVQHRMGFVVLLHHNLFSSDLLWQAYSDIAFIPQKVATQMSYLFSQSWYSCSVCDILFVCCSVINKFALFLNMHGIACSPQCACNASRFDQKICQKALQKSLFDNAFLCFQNMIFCIF